MKKVAVVVLNYKVKDLSLSCISSVLSSDYPDLEVIAVDNDSQDGFEGEIKRFKNVVFIQTMNNLGYTGGNNIGIKKALLDGAEYVFVLNPDTIILKNTISKLISGMEGSAADIVGPKIYFSSSKKIWFAGGKFDLDNVIGSHIGVDQIDQGQFNQKAEVDYVTGAAMMISSQVFNKIGLFDERFFLYYEDSDFCFRAKQMGFKIQYIPEAVVYHANAKSTGLGSPLQDYYITRNRMLFASKHLSFRTRFALLREAVKNITVGVRARALVDYMLGRFGKGSI